MFYFLWTLIRLLFFWLILSSIIRLFRPGKYDDRTRGGYSEWTYGNFGGNPYTATDNSGALASAYRTLEISPSATDSEVKSAFRRLVVKYHPDKYATATQQVQHEAEEKFKKINEAYQLIKKKRGMDA